MRLVLLPIALLVSGVALACGDEGSDPAGVTIDALVGPWEAEVFKFTSVDDPTVSFDLIAVGGAFEIDIQPDGSFIGAARLLDFNTGALVGIPAPGSITIVGDGTLIVDMTFDQGPFQFGDFEATFSLTGDILEIDGAMVGEFDFVDGSGDHAVPALWESRWRRMSPTDG